MNPGVSPWIFYTINFHNFSILLLHNWSMRFLILFILVFFNADSVTAKTDAHSLFKKASRNTTYPLVMNKSVLKELNRFIKKPGHRKHIRSCLKRMKKYESMVVARLEKHDMPVELMALPIIESCYQNITSKTGTGLWMFTKSTGRSYGLKINSRTDQRLHPYKATDAALKYLKNNYRRFNDWNLTILAYNVGENKILKAMKKERTQDVWKLIQRGHERDRGYLAKVMVAMVLIRNRDTILSR